MVVVRRATPLGVLKGLLDAEEDLGEFIANGPADGIKGWVRDKYRHRCNEFANLPGWAQALTGGAGGSVRRICEPYWDDNGWDGPTGETPFTGGQCEGTYYFVTVRFYNISTGAISGESTFEGFGPVRVVASGNQVPGPGGDCTTPGQSYQPGRALTFNGVERVSWDGGCGVRSGAEILSVVPRGSEPNDCGDPPPVPTPGPTRPPYPGPLPGPEPTTDPDDPEGPPLIPIPPFDDPFGGPTPIVGPDVFPPDAPDGPTPPPPGDVGEPGGEVIAEPGEDAEGEAPEGSVLVGIRLRLVVIPPRPNEWEPGIYRGVGYAYMGTAQGLDQDMAGAYISDGQFIFAEKENLTHWRFRVTNGFEVGVTPFYREVEE